MNADDTARAVRVDDALAVARAALVHADAALVRAVESRDLWADTIRVLTGVDPIPGRAEWGTWYRGDDPNDRVANTEAHQDERAARAEARDYGAAGVCRRAIGPWVVAP